ncbi:MAG TPA: hypothetical protein VHM91_20920 [Verrucomicrobiales bacterium]|jgi:hypothetical protein|nr:hypothetical protein [Verrucomicrobiales bacterium]
MSDPAEEAASQLRAIRSLMERSTIYRAISAPAAAFAGVVSLVLCWWLWSRRDPAVAPSPVVFMCLWLGVLLVASLVNLALLYVSARRRGDAFVSPGMKHALRALLPPLLAGFIMSLLQVAGDENAHYTCYANVADNWILFYGLALLATGSFAPASMQALGAGFFFMGILTFLPMVRDYSRKVYEYDAAVVHMAFSFGALHLIYAAAVFIQHRRSKHPAALAA